MFKAVIELVTYEITSKIVNCISSFIFGDDEDDPESKEYIIKKDE